MAATDSAQAACEEILNRIATEFVLAQPGKDDGLVPIYSLLNDLAVAAECELRPCADGARRVKQTLDGLLDASQPFDERTHELVGEYISWAQGGLLEAENGKQMGAFAMPEWAIEETGEARAALTRDEEALREKLNRIATELVLAKAGSEEGLVPVYAILGELKDLVTGESVFLEACQNVKLALDALLDEARPWDTKTLEYLGRFTTWAQPAISDFVANEKPEAFEPLEGLEAADESIAESVGAGSEAKDELLEVNLAEDQEILSEFRAEATEHLESIEETTLVLESEPKNKEGLAGLFRSFHTIKGVAGFLHLTPIQMLAHEVESLLDHARNGRLILTSEMITLILRARDTIQTLVGQVSEALETGRLPSEVVPVTHLIQSVEQAAKRALSGEGAEEPAGVAAPIAAADARAEEEEGPQAPSATPSAPAASAAANGGNGSAPVTRRNEGGTIRVNTHKLDNLMDMVGELVIVQSQLAESSQKLNGDGGNLQRNVSQLGRITRELQHTSMSLRLVPVKPTFQKVGRVVRDLSSTYGKKVDFHVSGEDTELDRNVVEMISDPLVHMVRNAFDHGLEPNAERVGLGKAEAGQVRLKAYHQGSNIVIELTDDGRGIDPKKLLAKAVRVGLVPEGVVPPDEELYAMIFQPGFSTAEKVTDVSGRGVGMDVVRRNIEQLRGKVELTSQVGAGTTFKIKLPLTTAIIDGLIVRVGEDRFILPTNSVKVALRPERKQVSTIKGQAEVLDLRGRTIPLRRLHQMFNIPTEVTKMWEGIVVIIETFGKPYGLLVDDMLSKQEVVIKNLGSLMHNVRGVAGGAILGDGTIALILDPSGLTKEV